MKLQFKIISILILPVLLASCSSSVRFSDASASTGSRYEQNEDKNIPSGTVFRGKASYYHDKFDGRQTANGEIFDQNKLTAAHKTLPFRTKLKVTNLKNGKSTIVIINDRGPFVGGRVIDLSRAAAERIDMIRDGIADVECEVLP